MVDVPEGTAGDWSIDRFGVSAHDESLGRMRAMMSFSSRGRFVPAGKYTRLVHNGGVVMSDTPDEIWDHRDLFNEARGDVLIHGLGLGMAARGCLLKPEVESVTIVEIEEDVIKLVGGWLNKIAGNEGKPLFILHDDALAWKPARGQRWNVVYHDIWPSISVENLKDMHHLHRRFARRCDWQASWNRSECEQIAHGYR